MTEERLYATDDPLVAFAAGETVEEWADVDPEWVQDTQADARPEEGDELDRQAAERLIKRVALTQRERSAALLFVDAEIAEAQARLDDLCTRREEIAKPYDRKLSYLQTFYRALEDWAREALAHAKGRSVKLAYGTIKFRKGPDKLDITDQEAAVTWCEYNLPAAVKRDVSKSAVKAYIKESGEIPEGCAWVPGEDTCTVDTE